MENKSNYAARTPAVVVEFRNAGILIEQHAATAGWTATARARGVYIMALQWDGGPNYSIHGNSFRYLPDLYLQGLRPFSDYPSEIVFRLLADGYNRPDIIVPITWGRDIESRPRKTPPEWF